ncbi:MAG: tetratricopeptide repeat protein [Bacteroidetes bacterium]|nr:tetratricopeptide repeat protein [Candidatus Colenecus caballi]
MRKPLIFLAFALMTLSAGAQGRYTRTDLQGLDECRTLFSQGDYAAAGTLLEGWLKSHNVTEETEYMTTVIAAECDMNTAMPAIRHFIQTYPMSKYMNRIRALEGSAYFAQKDYESAIESFEESDPAQLSDRDCERLVRHNAISLVRSGRTDEAFLQLSILDRLVDEPDADADLVFYHAYVDYMNGNTDKAVAGFENSMGTRHEDEARLYLAEIDLNGGGDHSRAYETANSLIMESDDPELQHEAERVLGEYFYRNGDYRQAADLLTSYLASDSSADMRYDQYLLGMSHYRGGDMDMAIENLSKVVEEDDDIAQNASLHAGLAYLKKGDRNMARISFERAQNIPGQPDVREQAMYNYAMVLQETAFTPFDQSVTTFERFLNEFPDSRYADRISEYLIDAYMSTTSYDAALASIDKIRNPSDKVMASKVQLLYRKAMDQFASGRYDDVPHLLTGVIDLSRYDAATALEATFWRGETYYRQGEDSRAAMDFRRYLSKSDNDRTRLAALANYGLGYIEYNSSSYSQSLKYMREVIDNAGKTGIQSDIVADACLRAGDCLFYTRQYNPAKDYYGRAMDLNKATGDYVLYQTAIVNGLQRKYEDKISNLKNLVSDYPSSAFVAAALYEQGRAYQQIDRQNDAISVFQRIRTEFPQSELARKAAAETALIYYQTDRYDDAIVAYKDVVRQYPGSDEAQTALEDLKSIYVEKGDVNSYIDFTQTVSGAAPIAVSERDSMTYAAAEGLFSRGDRETALKHFEDYLKQFPNGAFAVNAWYYQGLLLEEQNNYDYAFECFMHVADYENSRFSETAIDHAASMAWELGDYETAMDTYIRLSGKTTDIERQRRSLYRIVSSAAMISESDVVLQYADRALNAGLKQEQQTEVSFCKAEALLETGSGEQARPVLEELASDTRSQYGAQSAYLLGQYLFDSGNAAESEKVTMAFIQEGTPHMYWLARSFILLSDIYKSQGKEIEARQYLLSLKSNYTADDDIAQMIAKRLE